MIEKHKENQKVFLSKIRKNDKLLARQTKKAKKKTKY